MHYCCVRRRNIMHDRGIRQSAPNFGMDHYFVYRSCNLSPLAYSHATVNRTEWLQTVIYRGIGSYFWHGPLLPLHDSTHLSHPTPADSFSRP